MEKILTYRHTDLIKAIVFTGTEENINLIRDWFDSYPEANYAISNTTADHTATIYCGTNSTKIHENEYVVLNSNTKDSSNGLFVVWGKKEFEDSFTIFDNTVSKI